MFEVHFSIYWGTRRCESWWSMNKCSCPRTGHSQGQNSPQGFEEGTVVLQRTQSNSMILATDLEVFREVEVHPFLHPEFSLFGDMEKWMFTHRFEHRNWRPSLEFRRQDFHAAFIAEMRKLLGRVFSLLGTSATLLVTGALLVGTRSY